jgi:hypothetical protein
MSSLGDFEAQSTAISHHCRRRFRELQTFSARPATGQCHHMSSMCHAWLGITVSCPAWKECVPATVQTLPSHLLPLSHEPRIEKCHPRHCHGHCQSCVPMLPWHCHHRLTHSCSTLPTTSCTNVMTVPLIDKDGNAIPAAATEVGPHRSWAPPWPTSTGPSLIHALG